MAIGLFYGSTYGNTKKVAEMVKAEFDEEVELHSVEDLDPETLDNYDRMIFGVPTYGMGSLQEFWADFIWEMDDLDLSGKKVAIFGLGDQKEYPDSFVTAMKELADKVRELGGTVVGAWPTDGYEFRKSGAIEDGKFIGLVVDQDRQAGQTPERVKQWVAQIKSEL
jgi:flavodoxin I